MRILLVLLALAAIAKAQWEQIGPEGGGYISDFAVIDDRLFAASSYSGVYHSLDKGGTWTRVSKGINAYPFYALTSIEVVDGILFAGGRGEGLFRSADQGNTWKRIDSSAPGVDRYIGSVLDMARNGRMLFVAANSGLYRTSDLGASWNRLDGGLQGREVRSLLFRDGTLYAGILGSVFHSPDNGETWVGTDSALGAYTPESLARLGPYLFAAKTYGKVFRSADNGASWIPSDSGLGDSWSHSLAARGTEIFSATNRGVFYSTDSGASWIPRNQGMTAPSGRSLFLLDELLFAGAYEEGIFRSTDGGGIWAGSKKGLVNSVVESLVKSGPYLIAVGNGLGLQRSSDHGKTWSQAVGDISNQYVNTPLAFGDTLLVGNVYGTVFRSYDNGSSWTTLKNGLAGKSSVHLTRLGRRIIAAGSIWISVSLDMGETWAEADLGGIRSSIGSLGTHQGYLYAGTVEKGLLRSSDSGNTWAPLGGKVGDISVNFVAGSGPYIFVDRNGTPLRSADAGQTWEPTVSGLRPGLSSIFVGETGLFSPDNDAIYFSPDHGTTWTPIHQGEEPRYIECVTTDATHLYAGTYGFGVWSLPLSSLPVKRPSKPPGVRRSGLEAFGQLRLGQRVTFWLDMPSPVRLAVFDARGGKVATLVDASLPAGSHPVALDGLGASSGLYFLRLEALGLDQTRRLVLER